VSSDKTVRETTKRPHTLEAYVKVVTKSYELGFKIVSYQILGLPNESLDSMIQTLAFNAGLPVLLGASPFYQTPNAPIARGTTMSETDFIKARLTALAIETDNFCRDDIYTLFVTTRIINFVKGLPHGFFTDLSASMSDDGIDGRSRLGMEILARLAQTGQLFSYTKQGLVENRKFRAELFHRVLSEIGEITCQNGAPINLTGFLQQLKDQKDYVAAVNVRQKVAPFSPERNAISPP
jgi:hypothetical protein